VHADFDERDGDSGVLTDRAPPLGSHPRIHQDLRNGISGRIRPLPDVGAVQCPDVVGRMKAGNVLECVRDTFDEIALIDHVAHDHLSTSECSFSHGTLPLSGASRAIHVPASTSSLAISSPSLDAARAAADNGRSFMYAR